MREAKNGERVGYDYDTKEYSHNLIPIRYSSLWLSVEPYAVGHANILQWKRSPSMKKFIIGKLSKSKNTKNFLQTSCKNDPFLLNKTSTSAVRIQFDMQLFECNFCYFLYSPWD